MWIIRNTRMALCNSEDECRNQEHFHFFSILILFPVRNPVQIGSFMQDLNVHLYLVFSLFIHILMCKSGFRAQGSQGYTTRIDY